MTTYGFAPPSARRNLAPVREVLASLSEGDVVRAELWSRAYGTFTITGAVRHTLSPTSWVVGSWYLTQGDGGDPAKQLYGLTRVEDADDTVPVPAVTLEDLGQTD
ncbi:MAG TPA: hypothetical protein VGC57_06975 [Cellulomonas sp.]